MAYYDDIAQGYDKLHGDEQLNKLNEIKKHLNLKPNQTLLDVGCGSGISTSFFDCQATGVDPKREGKYLIGKAEALPFASNSFDCVLSVTAIQNFSDVEKGLKEIKRVGKGKFVLTVLKRSPKINLIKEKINTLFKVQKEIEEFKDLIFVCEK